MACCFSVYETQCFGWRGIGVYPADHLGYPDHECDATQHPVAGGGQQRCHPHGRRARSPMSRSLHKSRRCLQSPVREFLAAKKFEISWAEDHDSKNLLPPTTEGMFRAPVGTVRRLSQT